MSIFQRTSVDGALHILRDTNRSLTTTQNHVSTGLRVAKAQDNGAYWAIATTVRTDTKANGAIQDALGIAAATMGVASTAVNSAIEIVSTIKSKLVAATEEGVDKTKINDEITQLKAQLRSVSESASFNGDNWVVLTDEDDPTKPKEIPAAFIRGDDGSVKVSTLTYHIDMPSTGVTTSQDARYMVDDRAGGTGEYGALTTDHFATELGAAQNYVMIFSKEGDTTGQVEIGLDANTSADDLNDMISVADAALKQMTTVGSSFGALEKRIDLQNDFAKSLTDSYTSGIGRLVDANMEEESGRLAALQTQKQLGIQALQIANASYNTITQLFQNI